MNHVECPCGAEFPHPRALLEHYDAVHGGWRSRRVLRPTRDESNVVTTWRVA